MWVPILGVRGKGSVVARKANDVRDNTIERTVVNQESENFAASTKRLGLCNRVRLTGSVFFFFCPFGLARPHTKGQKLLPILSLNK